MKINTKVKSAAAVLLTAAFLSSFALSISARESAVDAYYRKAEESSPELLRKSLNEIIQKHRVLSYREVWNALKDTDRDPDHSDRVILIYTGRSIYREDNTGRQRNRKDFWNREHIWPKSHGFRDKRSAPFTDLHHIRPADTTVNSSRGNKDFDTGGSPHREAAGTRHDEDSIEPRKEVRGDIARMLFYMDVRYEGTGSEPDLILVNRTGTFGPELGKLCTLYRWHENDPVDAFEARRNERIFRIQGNRNPFIDRPDYAKVLWNSLCENK